MVRFAVTRKERWVMRPRFFVRVRVCSVFDALFTACVIGFLCAAPWGFRLDRQPLGRCQPR
jgi:hypothetical protein